MKRGAAIAVENAHRIAAPNAARAMRRIPYFEASLRDLLAMSQLELVITYSVASTVAAVTVLRDRAIFATTVVALAAEVTRVTAGAVRRELRVCPADHLRVVPVAVCATEIRTVIQRLIGQAGMHVDVRYPRNRFMAFVALAVGYEVTGIAASRRDAVVARGAGAKNLGMVDRRYRAPGRRVMAVLTNIGRQRVIRALTSCIGAVVAADAVIGDVGVIKVRRHPGNCCMAVVAIVTARDMSRVFASGDRAVVTGDAGADHLRVINRIDR